MAVWEMNNVSIPSFGSFISIFFHYWFFRFHVFCLNPLIRVIHFYSRAIGHIETGIRGLNPLIRVIHFYSLLIVGISSYFAFVSIPSFGSFISIRRRTFFRYPRYYVSIPSFGSFISIKTVNRMVNKHYIGLNPLIRVIHFYSTTFNINICCMLKGHFRQPM